MKNNDKMFSEKELIEIPEFWIEKYQNELYSALKGYMEKNNLNQTELAKKLNFSKSYISQVLKDGFNHSLRKFIELSLAIDRVPNIQLVSFEDYLSRKKEKTVPKSTPIILQLNSPGTLNISISTLRGIILEKTKGTVLQKEFLPIINPKMLLEKPVENGKAKIS